MSDDAKTTATTADGEGTVTTEVRGRMLLIGLNRPKKLNGLTPTMMTQLVDAYTRLDGDDDLWVGVVFGHGEHFTAGLDLTKFTGQMEQASDNKGGSNAHIGDVSRSGDRIDPFDLRNGTVKPVVFAVQGICFTAGLEMMLAGDIVIAADDCRFSQLEPKRAIHATGGATFRFVQRGGWGNAMYHLLTSDEFDASEAHRCGFVQEIVPAGQQLDRAIEIAEIIAAGAPGAVQATKASSKRYLLDGQQACIDALGPTQTALTKTADYAEGIASFIERRDPNFGQN